IETRTRTLAIGKKPKIAVHQNLAVGAGLREAPADCQVLMNDYLRLLPNGDPDAYASHWEEAEDSRSSEPGSRRRASRSSGRLPGSDERLSSASSQWRPGRVR